MKATINGKPQELSTEQTVLDLVRLLGYESGKGIAVAIDGEVVARSAWESVRIKEGQSVEVVRAVQGGS